MDKTPVYFVPGLAAGIDIFEYLQLPQDQFEVHYLEWIVPESKEEPLEHYAKRMSERIQHTNPVLIGVSFGGVMVQEMSKFLNTKKTIIISSVKCRKEMPKRLKLAKATKAYKLFPTKTVNNLDSISKLPVGSVAKDRIELYKKYLSMRDEVYLPWALYHVLHWQQTTPLENVIHIHGDKDHIFPIKYIENCVTVAGGGHAMILNKAKKISTLLKEVI